MVWQDRKAALASQLNRRKDLALGRASVASKPKKTVTDDSISKGRREIVIEPSCSVVIRTCLPVYVNCNLVEN